jgi:hypothetical protein
MEDEDLPQTVKLDSQTVTQITSEIDKTNILLKGQSVKLDEIDNSLVGILGIAKGTLELAPSLKPEINVQPGRQRPQRKPHKDSLTIETTQHSTDSIVITVNHGDSIVTTPHYEKIPSSQTGKKCCCCKYIGNVHRWVRDVRTSNIECKSNPNLSPPTVHGPSKKRMPNIIPRTEDIRNVLEHIEIKIFPDEAKPGVLLKIQF